MAFTYDAATKQWTSYQNPSQSGVDPKANNLQGIGIENVQLGKGYWIWLNNADALTVSGTIPAITPGISTQPGGPLNPLPPRVA